MSKWRTLSSKSLIKDRWIDVRADRCVTPLGTIIEPYYVLTYPDAVNIVALTKQNDIVLVEQYRHAVGETILELPGGAIDPSDDDAEGAARRELEEETGFVSARWFKVSSLYSSPASRTNRVHAFLALDATAERDRKLDRGEEGLGVCLMPFEHVLNNLQDGILGHAMNVSSLLLAERLAARLANIDVVGVDQLRT